MAALINPRHFGAFGNAEWRTHRELKMAPISQLTIGEAGKYKSLF